MRLHLNRRIAAASITALVVVIVLALIFANFGNHANAPKALAAGPIPKTMCTVKPYLCTELDKKWTSEGQYTGHDEPSVLFYSNQAGSGNNDAYRLILPKDPPTQPKQDGTGGVAGFQLHSAFWFGMILCDTQSSPNPGKACKPDSDSNIFTSTDPNSPKFIGKAPGTAYMELQFFPPNWGPVSCTDANGNTDGKWCVGMAIDSVDENATNGIPNNAACRTLFPNDEPANFAILTKNGKPVAPPNPTTPFFQQAVVTPNSLEMNSGDQISISLKDTSAGFQAVVRDATNGQKGTMTASAGNGFAHVLYQPSANTCATQNYSFHPMYSTSTPETRSFWSAHSYNVAMSDEIGHFQYCTAADPNTANCLQAGPDEAGGTVDSDDAACFPAPLFPTNQTFTGCLADNLDFDGTSYLHDWPGSLPNAAKDQQVHATPIAFTSPLFSQQHGDGNWDDNDLRNYQQVAFETDLPAIEASNVSPNNVCQRHVFNPTDPSPGTGCVDPPNGASFYPFYSAVKVGDACYWAEGDKNLPNAIDRFGGSPATAYGSLQVSVYPSVGSSTAGRYNTFRRILPFNPCPAGDH